MLEELIQKQKDIVENLEDDLERERFIYNLFLNTSEEQKEGEPMVDLKQTYCETEAKDVFQDKREPELVLGGINDIFSKFPSEEYRLDFDKNKEYLLNIYGEISEPEDAEIIKSRVGMVKILPEDNPYFMFVGIKDDVEIIKKVSYDLPLALTEEELELAMKAKDVEGSLWSIHNKPTYRDLENYLIRDNTFVVAGHYAVRDHTVEENMVKEGGIPFRYIRLLLAPVTTQVKREKFADKDYGYYMWRNGLNDVRAKCNDKQLQFFKDNIKSGTLDYNKVFSYGVKFDALKALDENFISLGIFKLKFNQSSFKKEDYESAEDKNDFIMNHGRLTIRNEFKHMYNMDKLFPEEIKGEKNE